MLDLNEYQQRAQRTMKWPLSYPNTTGSPAVTTGALNYSIIALAGEAGELANKWKKLLRVFEPSNQPVYDTLTSDDVAKLIDELGDCLWYVAAVATSMGILLESVAAQNIEKLSVRYAPGTEPSAKA